MGVYETLPVDAKRFGFRIYHLSKDGPLHKAGLNEFSDFLIPPDEVYENKKPFSDWISQHAGQVLNLQVYSLKNRVFKPLTVKANPKDSKDGYLGAAIRYENWSIAHKNVLHVINVKENSFAKDKLGLVNNDDYIIAIKPEGTNVISLNKEDEDPLTILSKGIKEHLGCECDFYLYNVNTGSRVVTARIEDNSYFTLGCDVAYGKLHEFPLVVEKNEKEEDIKVETLPVEKKDLDEVKKEVVVQDPQRLEKEKEKYKEEEKKEEEKKEDNKQEQLDKE